MIAVEDIETMEQLKKQIESSTGWKIEKGNRNLRVSHYIFMSNYNQLKNSLELFNRKEVSSNIWAIKNRDNLNQFQIEVIRLFHNYLASVKSLIDHTRIMVNEVYGNNDFSKEYILKIKDVFANSSLARFVQDLRNYILHKGIPVMLAQMKSKESEETNSILLDLSSLRSWDGWKAKSKEYLNNAKDHINLYEIIVAYESLVINFFDWFQRRQNELYSEEFEQTQKIKDEYNKIVLKILPPLPDD
ncbi:MAG: hypothetical protein NTX42_11875 [Methanothrix sp.]|nr:hypothetical protein [Methanothrix sp.]